MKTTAFLILSAGVLICSGVEVSASEAKKKEADWKAKDEEVKPPRPTFPLFMLSSFSLPTLNFPQIPYLQGLSPPNRLSSTDGVRDVKATKTEYVEVTRRQTVHPVCYTAYEVKSPCLPHAHSYFQDDVFDKFEFDAVHQTHENFQLNEVRKAIRSTPTFEVTQTRSPPMVREEVEEEEGRDGRYLQFRRNHEEPQISSSRIEGSEFVPISIQFGSGLPKEQVTKTVLITKLEKYTDRRVTATLLAMNCLPVDRSIPKCQSYPNPIRETPDNVGSRFEFSEKVGDTAQMSREEQEKQIIATLNAVREATKNFAARKNLTEVNEKEYQIEPSESSSGEVPVEDATEPLKP